VLAERGELDHAVLTQCHRDCLRDVVHGWISEPELRRLIRSPRLVLASALAALALIGLLSQGFAGTRALFHKLPLEDPERLVWIRYTGTIGQPAGVPPRVLPGWKANSTLLSDIAAYWHRPYHPVARVTPNFFNLLGTKPAAGRLFEASDRDVALLSDRAARQIFGPHAQVLGRSLSLDGRNYTVVGVLPKDFWAISPRVTVWVPLRLDPSDPGLPVLLPAVGRMKPGVGADAVRTDLLKAAAAAHQPLPRRPEVLAFTFIPGTPLFGYLFWIGFALLVGAVMTWRQQLFNIRFGGRYGRYLVAKTLLFVIIPALAWIEASSAVRAAGPPDSPFVAITGFVLTLLFLALGSFAFWWSFADQRGRCPQCLELLAMPVTMGSWSSVLDPVTTEFLCESGHGSLYVPETEQGEPDHWTALDPSWRELFEKVTPEGP
jgi:hypothetical protein